MADPQGFLKYPRVEAEHRPVAERIKDWYEVDRPLAEETIGRQVARCMDCGVPFCHAVGCPLSNRIPEFNDLVYRGRWREASENLHSTNNFPEITGRVCPAPCEAACTLHINREPVTIRQIECQIVDRAFREGWIAPARVPPASGFRVAVVGSGPAGLTAAQQLARAGHEVVVFERSDRVGGLLRYGIPDFKMEKRVLDRRLEQMTAEGVKFETDITVGVDLSARYLQKSFDAICLCMGAGRPRKLDVPGAELDGVHLALDFLTQQNRRVAGDPEEALGQPVLSAAGKHVIVIGGGDTGSDCVGTSIRQRAASVTQLEILPKPPEGKNPETPWPEWPKVMRTSSSQEEGCERRWSVLTKSLSSTNGRLSELHGCEVDWIRGDRGWETRERPGTDFILPADMILLAMGFVHVEHSGLIEALGLETDGRGNLIVRDQMTSVEGVFAAGDAVRGASLVVHAIDSGRQTAAAVDRWLKQQM